MRTLAWIRRVWSSEEYTEPEMFARAALIDLPLLLLLLMWDWPQWWRAVISWLAASYITYRYGHWVRDDEDDT